MSASQYAQQPREIRVFLSSTFRDMDAERNYLLKQVFPKIRAACLSRQVGFTEIDLRWGVTEEESKNGATVEICLAEIDRCRDFPPFFIGFLGERYGWIPVEQDLAAYWERNADSPYVNPIRDAISRGISVTELEMELAVLASGAAEKLKGHALFLLRDRALTDTLYQKPTGRAPDPSDAGFYDPAKGRLAVLKDRIRATPFLGIDGYRSVEDFGQAVEDYLLAQLDAHFPENAVPSPLERQNAAHSAFAWLRLQNFLPREDVRTKLLSAIDARLETPALGPILLCGPNGQGKSALMADLARHVRATRPEWRVIDHYTGADDKDSIDAWITRILGLLHPDIANLVNGIPESPKEQKEALSTWIAMACRRQEQKANRPTGSAKLLLILDALDQNSDGGKDLEALRLEILGADAILVTSAADGTPAKESAKGFEAVEVPPFTDAMRTTMIADTLKRFRKALPTKLAKQLARAPQCGSPLFLSLALEELRLDARHECLESLIDEILLAKDSQALFLNRFLLDEDYGRPEMPTLAAPFMALLGASHSGLTELELSDLLAMPEDPQAEDTHKPRLPQVHLSRLLTNLGPYLLNKGGRRAPMHRIFGEAALHYYSEVPVRRHLYDFFASGYGDAEGDEFDARGAAEALYQITRLATLNPANRPDLEADLARLPIPAGLHNQEEQVVFDALNVFDHEQKAALGTHWGEQVGSLVERDVDHWGEEINNFAGWIKERIGHYSAARAMQEPLVEVHRRIVGEEHWKTLGSIISLAVTLFDQGDLPASQAMNEQVFQARRRALGPEHPDTLRSMGQLASLLYAQGDLPASQALDEQILETRRRVLDQEHPDTLMSMGNLAITLHERGDLPGARGLQEQVLAMSRRIHGLEHPFTLSSMNNLANTLFSQGDLPGTRTLNAQVLESRRRIFGQEHPDTLSVMNNLANTLRSQGDLLGARALNEQVLETQRRVLGQEHPHVLISLSNLASTLRDQGNLPEARALYEQALELRRRILGREHPHTLGSMNNLAVTLSDQGDLSGARVMKEQVLEIRRRIFGPDHPDTLSSMSNLATALHLQGDLQGARKMKEQALDAFLRVLGPEHPDTLVSMSNLAITLQEQGDLQGARAMKEQVLELHLRILGPEHPETLSSTHNLASAIYAQGDQLGARVLLENVLEIRSRILGPEHPDTLVSMRNMVFILNEIKEADAANRLRSERRSILRQIAERNTPEQVAKFDAHLVVLQQWAALKTNLSPDFDWGDEFGSVSLVVGSGGVVGHYAARLNLKADPPSLSLFIFPGINISLCYVAAVQSFIDANKGVGQLELTGDKNTLRWLQKISMAEHHLSIEDLDTLLAQGIARLDAVMPTILELTARKAPTSPCWSCNAPLQGSAKFCTECGVPQQRQCEKCQTMLPGSASFCTECGQPIAPH